MIFLEDFLFPEKSNLIQLNNNRKITINSILTEDELIKLRSLVKSLQKIFILSIHENRFFLVRPISLHEKSFFITLKLESLNRRELSLTRYGQRQKFHFGQTEFMLVNYGNYLTSVYINIKAQSTMELVKITLNDEVTLIHKLTKRLTIDNTFLEPGNNKLKVEIQPTNINARCIVQHKDCWA